MANNAFAIEADRTQFLERGKLAPFNGYLVAPSRFEKVVIALGDLQSTKENSLLKDRLLEISARDQKLLEQKLEAEKKESESVEKGLKDRVAELDVWYKKPWFVAAAVAAIFITTGTLLP